MRLTQQQREIIRKCVHDVDPDADIRLFGSRVDEETRGGDIDLLCLSKHIDRPARRRLKRKLSDCLGGQRVDLIVANDANRPFVRLILPESKPVK